jgi:hypothetical protein
LLLVSLESEPVISSTGDAVVDASVCDVTEECSPDGVLAAAAVKNEVNRTNCNPEVIARFIAAA